MSLEQSGSDDTDVVGMIILICLGALVLPALIPQVRDAAAAWLVNHHILVPATEALVPIPFMGGGLDLRRLVIIGLVLAAAVWVRHAQSGGQPSARGGAGRG